MAAENEMTEPQFKVTLRIIGEFLDPEEVTRTLGVSPHSAHRTGDARVGQAGRRYADHRTGMWKLKSRESGNASLKAHIEDVLRYLPRQPRPLAASINGATRADVFVGVFAMGDNPGFDLEPETMRLLEQFGLTLTFDLYSWDDV